MECKEQSLVYDMEQLLDPSIKCCGLPDDSTESGGTIMVLLPDCFLVLVLSSEVCSSVASKSKCEQLSWGVKREIDYHNI